MFFYKFKDKDGINMRQNKNHYSIELPTNLNGELWQILTDKFNVMIKRQSHSIDGEENHVWLEITDIKSK